MEQVHQLKAKLFGSTKIAEESMNEEKIVETFRRWGYLKADLDSLDRLPPFKQNELEKVYDKGQRWKEIYCSKIGAEFMHIPFTERTDWVADKMENGKFNIDQRFVLKRILESETFEKFLHTRYVGSKRFSLEGTNALIPLLDTVIELAVANGTEHIMLAMAHRGRLNVMHHIAGTLTETIIAAFEDVDPKSMLGRDDVKYHKGATGVYKTRSGKEVFIDLAPNPSHLEAINPVLLGRVKARQQRLADVDRSKVLGIILHGDAAFAGQGVAAETLNYETVPGFEVGGVINVVINNLIGFTAVPESLHSSRFATDIAKRLPIPIFHVNGESPDDVVKAANIATEYRNKFKSDVVIDLIGFRRFGHNEQDDPTITSPVLYRKIAKKPLLFESYAEEIGVADEDIKQLLKGSNDLLEEGLRRGRQMKKQPAWLEIPNYWKPYVGGFHQESLEVDTTISKEVAELIGNSINKLPNGFTIHPKVGKVYEQRQKMSAGQAVIDWGMAETLAFGSLLLEGTPVRLTGQDCRRGTFSHRNSFLYDYENGNGHCPLANLSSNQAKFDIFDSVLSEAAAVGYEYGYTRDYPEALVLWEAQFGDFVNGAQIIIDQFIVAGEDKWNLLSGLVMLLPHGFEGAGPEHSSARLERFLQGAAEENYQVCYPSNAAQYFHMLRRQAKRNWRKPLIVMTPKSLLRSATASSPIEAFTDGGFKNIIPYQSDYENVEKLLLCTGKVTHELIKEKNLRQDFSVGIISVEQLYPFPESQLVSELKKYTNAKSIVWVQEEPANMGALQYIRPHLERIAGSKRVSSVRRSESASPATGSPKAHALEQEAIVKSSFAKFGSN